MQSLWETSGPPKYEKLQLLKPIPSTTIPGMILLLSAAEACTSPTGKFGMSQNAKNLIEMRNLFRFLCDLLLARRNNYSFDSIHP